MSQRRFLLAPALLASMVIAAIAVTVVGASSSGSAADASATSNFAARINAGGRAYVDSLGTSWQADADYSGGATAGWPLAIAGSSSPMVYETERYGQMTYTVPVPSPGTYTLRVHLAEVYFTAPGQRAFNIVAQGVMIGAGVDVFALAGGNRSYVIQTTVTVGSGGSVVVTFQRVVQNPKVSGIEVLGPGALPGDPLAMTTVVTGSTVATTTKAPTAGTRLPASSRSRPAAAAPPAPTTTVTPPPTTTVTPAPTTTVTPAPTTTRLPTSTTAAVPPATTPSPSPARPGPLGVGWRPFAATSPWNTPIVASPTIDPASAQMVANFVSRPAVADIYADGVPIYVADGATPRYLVTCTEPWGTCPLSLGTVPVPAIAQPAPGSDHAMVIVDTSTGQTYELWQASRIGATWQAAWGAVEPLSGDGLAGIGGSYGGTGSGDSNLAGVVLASEITSGVIPHALAVSSQFTCANTYRYPALKTDGSNGGAACVPEGTRLQLDPSINVDAVPGITGGERVVAHALQTYGAYVHDTAGTPLALVFQNPLGVANPYPAAGFASDYTWMPHIPWSALRVLRSWNGS